MSLWHSGGQRRQEVGWRNVLCHDEASPILEHLFPLVHCELHSREDLYLRSLCCGFEAVHDPLVCVQYAESLSRMAMIHCVHQLACVRGQLNKRVAHREAKKIWRSVFLQLFATKQNARQPRKVWK